MDFRDYLDSFLGLAFLPCLLLIEHSQFLSTLLDINPRHLSLNHEISLNGLFGLDGDGLYFFDGYWRNEMEIIASDLLLELFLDVAWLGDGW